MDRLFNSSLGLQLSADQIIQTLIDFMRADEKRRYKIIIGSDSERKANGTADFVTAIVIHRVGNGGRYFWRHGIMDKKFHTLRDRIVQEVLFSLEVAKDILEKLNAATAVQPDENPNWDFEIHVDVGENGASRTMIQELVAMVRANNFEAKTKPESYAASKVADRHV